MAALPGYAPGLNVSEAESHGDFVRELEQSPCDTFNGVKIAVI